MSATVTLNVFSGRPNPRWILSDDAAFELLDRVHHQPSFTPAGPPGAAGGLGYRGLEIRFDDAAEPLYIHGGVVGTPSASPNIVDAQRQIERFVIDTMPDAGSSPSLGIDRDVHGIVRDHIEKDLAARFVAGIINIPILLCPANVGACAPPYEPSMWNVAPTLGNNNCYNYANDRITNTFAQPGRYHNAMYTQLTCASVQPAAVADGLVAAPNFTTPISDGWYVALVIWPGVDFHWYRQDNGGCWSHKPGSTAARNYDNSNHTITNPQTADRGGYTQFCSFMITRPCKVRIK